MESLDKYSDRIMNECGIDTWEIGWESLPKYIGHKIFNRKTKDIVHVSWNNGYPEMIKEDGSINYFCCNEFRHSEALWIYKVGEEY